MPRTPSRLLLFLFPFFASALLLKADDLPPAPTDGLGDGALVFDAGQATQIRAQFQETLQRDGVAVYVTTFTFISGGKVRERCTELMKAWSGEDPGLVLAYNRGEGQPALSVSPGFWRRYPSDEVAQLLQETAPILSDEIRSPDSKLLSAMQYITGNIKTMELARQARSQLFRPEDTRLATILGAALGALILLVWVISFRVRKQGAARRLRHYLPEVEVGMRLGAPNGGGTIAEASAKE